MKRLVRKRDVPALVAALTYTDLPPGAPAQLDGGAQVRAEAIVALTNLGAVEAVDPIAARLRDPNPSVRLTAVRAIHRLGAERAVDPLARTVATFPQEPYAPARREAFEVLRGLEAPELALRLVDALIGAGEEAAVDGISKLALVELARGKEPQVVDALVQQLDETLEERELIEAMLAWLGEPSVQPCIRALEDPAACASAANVVGALKASAAVPALAEHIGHPDVHARRSVVWALGEIRDPRGVEALLRATADEQFPVRLAAQEALDTMGTVAIVAGMTATIRPQLAEGARQGARAALAQAEPQLIAALSADRPKDRGNGESERSWAPRMRRFVERL